MTDEPQGVEQEEELQEEELQVVEEPVPDALSAEHGYPALATAFVLSPAPPPQARGRIEHLRREPRAPGTPAA